jgi:four helix bundle protein
MPMNETELKARTKMFGLRILKVIDALPETRSGRVLANQLGRSGTSVGANYRAACRSRSVAEMVSKISIVEEEADESAYWLEMVVDHGLMSARKVMPLHTEADEITAIMVASRKTLLASNRKSRIENRKSAP